MIEMFINNLASQPQEMLLQLGENMTGATPSGRTTLRVNLELHEKLCETLRQFEDDGMYVPKKHEECLWKRCSVDMEDAKCVECVFTHNIKQTIHLLRNYRKLREALGLMEMTEAEANR